MINVRDYLSSRENEVEDVEPGPGINPVIGKASPQGSVFGALMRQENTVGSLMTNQMRRYHKGRTPTPDFKWYEHIPEGYLDFAQSFSKAQSQDDIDDIRFQVDLENQDKAIIGNKPITSFFTGFIVGALDPTSLVPGTALYKGAKQSLTATRMALNTASSAFASTALQETFLQDLQYARTLEESTLNLLATTFVGAGLGAGAGKFLNTPNGKKAVADVARVMDDGQIGPDGKVSDSIKGIDYQAFKEAEEAFTAGGAETERVRLLRLNNELDTIKEEIKKKISHKEQLEQLSKDVQVLDDTYEKHRQELEEPLNLLKNELHMAEIEDFKFVLKPTPDFIKGLKKGIEDAEKIYKEGLEIAEKERQEGLQGVEFRSQALRLELKNEINSNKRIEEIRAELINGPKLMEGQSVGAAFNPEINPEAEELLMSETMRKIYGSSLGKLTPLTRGLSSPFASVRNTITQILETNLFQKKNTAEFGFEETPHALETIIRHDRMQADRVMGDYEDVFYEMNGFSKGEKFRSVKHFLDRKNQVSWDDFERGAWLAVIREGSDNPSFAKGGQILKNGIFEPWKEKMIQIGELPPNVTPKTAMGYFTRVYNIDKINDPRFHGRWETDDPDTFYTRVKKYVLRVNDMVKQYKPEADEHFKEIKRLGRKERRVKSLEKELKALQKRASSDQQKADAALQLKEAKTEKEKQSILESLIEKHRLSEMEIKELEEELAAEFNTAETIEQMQGQGFHKDDLEKFRALEKEVEYATAKKEGAIASIEKQLAQAEADLEAEIEYITSLKEKPEGEVTHRPDIKARNKSLSEVKAKHDKKIGVLKERLKNAEKTESANIDRTQKAANDFSSDFSKEKMTAYLNIVSLDERIKAAKHLQEVEAKYQDKSAVEKINSMEKYLQEEQKRLFKNEYRMQKIQELLDEPGMNAKDTTKAIQDLEKAIQEKFPADIFTSKGHIRTILETDLEAQTSIDNIIDNIRGLNDNRYNNPLLRGMTGGSPDSTKNRHFLIPDEELGDFLVQSPSKVVPMFIRGVVPFYHLTKWAKENGFETQNDIIKHKLDKVLEEYKKALDEAVPPEKKQKIKEEFSRRLEETKDPENPLTWTDAHRIVQQELTEALRGAADPKYAAWLTKRFREAEGDIKDSLSVLMGTFGNGENIMDNTMAKIAKGFTAWNYVRMMGYMVISSLTDPGSIIAQHGVGRFVAEGLRPLVNGLQGAKHNRKLLKDIGRACESYNGHRLKSFADQEGLVNETGLFGKTMHYVTQGFNNLSLMSYWTDAMQYIAGNVSISRTLRGIDDFMNGKIKDKEIQRIVNLGIKKEDFKKIHEQYQLHGGQEDGSYYINWGEWDTNTPEGLASLNSFRYALLKDVDQTVILPTIGDKPLFAKTVLGTLLFQFKSFAFAATNKLLIPGMQRQDTEFAQGVISLLAMGGISYTTSRLLKNQPIEEDPVKFAYEAFDRSGLGGILMEVPLTLQKMGLLPGLGTSRYNSRGWLGALGGPTLGTVEDITYLLNRFKNADETPLTDKDSDKILKLMPGNNIWWLDGINRNLGLTKSASHQLGFEETE